MAFARPRTLPPLAPSHRYDDWFDHLRNSSASKIAAENNPEVRQICAEQDRFRTFARLCGLPFIDEALYDKYIVVTCTPSLPQSSSQNPKQHKKDGASVSGEQYTKPFLPTLTCLKHLNAILLQQYHLANLALRAAAQRDATVQVILTETCCAALNIFPLHLFHVHINHKSPTGSRSSSPGCTASCSAATHRRMATLLRQLDERTDNVVMLILLWRRNLATPQPFMIRNENYLLRIEREIDLLVNPCHHHLQRAKQQQQAEEEQQKREEQQQGTSADDTSMVEHGNSVLFSDFDEEDEDDQAYTSYYLSRTRGMTQNISRNLQEFLIADIRRERQANLDGQNLSGPQQQQSSTSLSVNRPDLGISCPRDQFRLIDLIRTVFAEQDLQQQYIGGALLLNAKGQYSPMLKSVILPYHRLGLCQDIIVSNPAYNLIDGAPYQWLPLPFFATLKNDEANQGAVSSAASVTRSNYSCISIIDEKGCISLDVMKFLFRPPPSNISAGQPQHYDISFNAQIQDWLVVCLTNARDNIEAFVSERDNLPSEASIRGEANDFTEEGLREQQSRHLEKRHFRRVAKHFFRRWRDFTVVTYERQKIATKLLIQSQKQFMAVIMERWHTAHDFKTRRAKAVAELERKSAILLMRIWFIQWKNTNTLTLIARNIHKKLLRRYFIFLYLKLLTKKMHDSVVMGNASPSSGCFDVEKGKYVALLKCAGSLCVIPPPAPLRHLYYCTFITPYQESTHSLSGGANVLNFSALIKEGDLSTGSPHSPLFNNGIGSSYRKSTAFYSYEMYRVSIDAFFSQTPQTT